MGHGASCPLAKSKGGHGALAKQAKQVKQVKQAKQAKQGIGRWSLVIGDRQSAIRNPLYTKD
ncbi:MULTISPECIES: hypothetical protein [unclassified Microcoleus]|uniref:hypothetical protein n=1 Tax=unclassified Microcoleus TaxID=2642155 RepID=UPI002FD0D75B